mmetsp:Transcript_25984/g.52177  ORF Transcript_25984/g.52177 Transcript_25984/m.52177 type:complete len:225 (+) Transcript_25984:154-828(+)
MPRPGYFAGYTSTPSSGAVEIGSSGPFEETLERGDFDDFSFFFFSFSCLFSTKLPLLLLDCDGNDVEAASWSTPSAFSSNFTARFDDSFSFFFFSFFLLSLACLFSVAVVISSSAAAASISSDSCFPSSAIKSSAPSSSAPSFVAAFFFAFFSFSASPLPEAAEAETLLLESPPHDTAVLFLASALFSFLADDDGDGEDDDNQDCWFKFCLRCCAHTASNPEKD